MLPALWSSKLLYAHELRNPPPIAPSAPTGGQPQSDAPARDVVGRALAPWLPGALDIHHIATGRGNSTLVMMPDGTSLLIDAGVTNNALDVSFEPRPNDERRPGQWIARYVRRRLRDAGNPTLDYMLCTHNHPDHVGDVNASTPWSARGKYRLTGLMDVAEDLSPNTLIDRGYPDYAFPTRWTTPWAENYFAFVQARSEAESDVQRFRVGSTEQIRQRRSTPATYKDFEVRNVAANGVVWSGRGDAVQTLFPPLDRLPRQDWPNENHCSIAIRIGYGNFSYHTAGDLTSYTHDGALPWQDVLGAVARAVGHVTVATADHHGMFDSLSPEVVRIFRPKAWVIPTWHISHPDQLQLERMLSERLYPGPRDVFATTVMLPNILANRRLISRLQSTDGHVVVRVAPGGSSFTTVVTNNRSEDDTVKLVRGPTVTA